MLFLALGIYLTLNILSAWLSLHKQKLWTMEEGTIDLITSGQVARLANVSPTAVQMWVRSGRLRAARKTGATGIRLFSLAVVEQFLKERAAKLAGRVA